MPRRWFQSRDASRHSERAAPSPTGRKPKSLLMKTPKAQSAGRKLGESPAPRWLQILDQLKRDHPTQRDLIAYFDRPNVWWAAPKREPIAESLAKTVWHALEDRDFCSVMASYPRERRTRVGASFIIELAFLKAPSNSRSLQTVYRAWGLLHKHDGLLATLQKDVEPLKDTELFSAYAKAREALNRQIEKIERVAAKLLLVHRPDLYGKKGRAISSPTGAKRGAAVRRVALYVPNGLRDRFSVIARLVTKFFGESVTRQVVRRILVARPQEPRPRPSSTVNRPGVRRVLLMRR